MMPIGIDLDANRPMAGGHNDSFASEMDTTSNGWGNEINVTQEIDETTITQPERHHRVRTPPPLARALHAASVTAEDAPDSNSSPVNASSTTPGTLQGEPAPSTNRDAPTVAEFTSRRAKEIRNIMGGRKPKPNRKIDQSKGPKSISDYSKEEQGVIYIMRASIQHTLMALVPWVLDDEPIVERAKDFAKKHTKSNIDEMATDEFIKTVCPSLPQNLPFLLIFFSW
jgi:hypothetical protein